MTIFMALITAAVLTLIFCFFVLPKLIATFIRKLFANGAEKLLAYHLLTGRQLLQLLQEIAPWVGRQLTLEQAQEIAAIGRQKNDWQVRSMSDDWTEEKLLSDPVMQEVFGLGREQIATLIASVSPEDHILQARGAASYYPASPPEGDIHLPSEHQAMRGAIIHWPAGYPSRWHHHGRFVEYLAKAGDVIVIVRDTLWARIVLAYLKYNNIDIGKVRFVTTPYDDIWVRDCGPTFVRGSSGIIAIANHYSPNGLGLHKRDTEAPIEIARALGVPAHRLPVIIEGGNMVPDGEDGMFLCDSVFDHNPDIDRAKLANIFNKWFGIERLVILPSLPHEVTGHADLIVKVAEPGVLIVTEAPTSHIWHATIEKALQVIQSSRRKDGSAWTIHRMPMAPGRKEPSEWCYTNALTINNVIIAPSYDPKSDTEQAAARVFAAASPNRELFWIDYRDFSVGAVHCQSKEVPTVGE
jgi:agmatine/peptidylarginine deiminase